MVGENSPAAIFGSPPFLTPIHKIFREGRVLLPRRVDHVALQSRMNWISTQVARKALHSLSVLSTLTLPT